MLRFDSCSSSFTLERLELQHILVTQEDSRRAESQTVQTELYRMHPNWNPESGGGEEVAGGSSFALRGFPYCAVLPHSAAGNIYTHFSKSFIIHRFSTLPRKVGEPSGS